MSDVDPDFLALTQRQRTRIDRAFDRGLPKLRSSGRKRRKLSMKSDKKIPDDAAGGFMDDAMDGEGGFMDGGDAMDPGGGFVDDDGGDEGGFMVDDGEGGGFMPENDPDEAPNKPIPGPSKYPQSTLATLRFGKIPFSVIPGLLTSLNLPADEDVLNVFRASATGWATDDDQPSGPGRKRGKGGEVGDETLGVERKDFRAVCAAIMGEDDDDEGMDEDIEEQAEEADEGSEGSSGDEDAFTLDDRSSLSSLSSDSEYGASRKKTRTDARRTRKSASPSTSTPAKRPRTKKTKLEDAVEQGPLRLAGRQKEAVKDLWEMLKRTNNEEQPTARGRGKGSANVLGREEVKMWAREMGEMWTEDEITDMVTLFSTQHEGRGLSFDDFGQVMLRARVV